MLCERMAPCWVHDAWNVIAAEGIDTAALGE